MHSTHIGRLGTEIKEVIEIRRCLIVDVIYRSDNLLLYDDTDFLLVEYKSMKWYFEVGNDQKQNSSLHNAALCHF